MKRLVFSIIFVIHALFCFSQSKDFKWSIGGSIGGYGILGDQIEGINPQITLTRYLSPSFDLMSSAGAGVTYSNKKALIDLSYVSANLQYKFYNGSLLSDDVALKPYIFTGIAVSNNYGKTLLGFNGGLGIRTNLSEKWAIFSEFGYLQTPAYTYSNSDPRNTNSIRRRDRLNYWRGTVGISFQFGGYPDDDDDGVNNDKDKCPNTPPHVSVNQRGCPVDSDNDGVPDFEDLCPLEVGSLEFAGCVSPHIERILFEDRDADGVFDVDDACLDSIGPVESNGCPSDFFGASSAPDNPPVIYFDFDKYTLNESEKQKLDEFLSKLELAPNYSITVYGNTDSFGREDYNYSLSVIRAKVVKAYLVANGLDESRIIPKGLGEINPLGKDNNLNRRVSIELIPMP